MRIIFKALLVTLVIAFSAPSKAANSWGTDMSDLWWNPNESGWGANIAHQGEVLFMTLFVYGFDGRARWYVASNMVSGGAPNWYRFSGALYETQGPWLGGAFNSNALGVRQVGNATFSATSVSTGTLSYSVDGVTVLKSVERQTFRSANLTGNYGYVMRLYSSTCQTSNNGVLPTGTISISHNTDTGVIAITKAPSSPNQPVCTWTSRYTQKGRLGYIAPVTGYCNNGLIASPTTLYEIEAAYDSLRMTLLEEGSCTSQGSYVLLKN